MADFTEAARRGAPIIGWRTVLVMFAAARPELCPRGWTCTLVREVRFVN